MRTKRKHPLTLRGVTRRHFMKAGALGAAALMTSAASGRRALAQAARPNFLFIITDQQGLDTLSALGCRDIHTPNMDRLAERGVSFMESHSTNPLCSPARSSLFSGRMPSETGVIVNGRPIRDDIPNMGQWLSQQGYETVYVGKWHLPGSFTNDIPGFNVIPAGLGGQGTLGDSSISRACDGYLRNRTGNKPFLLVASFLQPHDICQWVSMHANAPDVLPHPSIADELPELPPNFHYDHREPAALANRKRMAWSEQQWRYYIWSYYRMVEEVDAEIGRVLQALDASGHIKHTIVILTADHGEGRARHQMVTKNYLYDEAEKVPMIVSWPGQMPEGKKDKKHLVSGLDVVPTMCDYAGIKPPNNLRGYSLRPVLEEKDPKWRDFVPAEVTRTGRMIRTADYKYIAYKNDPVEQLFDMSKDPWETKNRAGDTGYAAVLEDHRTLLREWESCLDVAPDPTGKEKPT